MVVQYNNKVNLLNEQDVVQTLNLSGIFKLWLSRTGKASRELFERKVSNDQSYKNTFLTI